MSDTNKIKHLEFIQSIITRFNSNSFMIKGWVITLMAAVFAISAAEKDLFIGFLNYLILPAFWILDGFYLSKERQYRKLYTTVISKTENDIDFDLNANAFNRGKDTWMSAIFSKTLIVFYPTLIILTIISIYLING